jgi:7-cyano-7-deazaguanine reductase
VLGLWLTKRHVMNRVARDGGYDVLATGHNLDDEAATLFGNTLTWSTGYLARQGPVLPAMAGGLARKVKPFFRFYERETAAYALLRGIEYIYDGVRIPSGRRRSSTRKRSTAWRRSSGAEAFFYLSFLEAKRNGAFAADIREAPDGLHHAPLRPARPARPTPAFCEPGTKSAPPGAAAGSGAMTDASDLEGLTARPRRSLPKAGDLPKSQSRSATTLAPPNDEFTCVCPATGQPDFGTITVEVRPGRHAQVQVLQLYLWSYRNEGVFHEHVTNTILDDLVAALEPRWCRVAAPSPFAAAFASPSRCGTAPAPGLMTSPRPALMGRSFPDRVVGIRSCGRLRRHADRLNIIAVKLISLFRTDRRPPSCSSRWRTSAATS